MRKLKYRIALELLYTINFKTQNEPEKLSDRQGPQDQREVLSVPHFPKTLFLSAAAPSFPPSAIPLPNRPAPVPVSPLRLERSESPPLLPPPAAPAQRPPCSLGRFLGCEWAPDAPRPNEERPFPSSDGLALLFRGTSAGGRAPVQR